jgi:hypothetical protein
LPPQISNFQILGISPRGPSRRAGDDIDRHAGKAHFNDLLIFFRHEPTYDVIALRRDCCGLTVLFARPFGPSIAYRRQYQETAPGDMPMAMSHRMISASLSMPNS